MPNGQGGIGLGFVQGSAVDFTIEAQANGEGLNMNGDARLGERCLQDQILLSNEGPLNQIPWPQSNDK